MRDEIASHREKTFGGVDGIVVAHGHLGLDQVHDGAPSVGHDQRACTLQKVRGVPVVSGHDRLVGGGRQPTGVSVGVVGESSGVLVGT